MSNIVSERKNPQCKYTFLGNNICIYSVIYWRIEMLRKVLLELYFISCEVQVKFLCNVMNEDRIVITFDFNHDKHVNSNVIYLSVVRIQRQMFNLLHDYRMKIIII